MSHIPTHTQGDQGPEQSPKTVASTQDKTVWFVYLLQCADGTLYCGVTTNLERRIDQHNRGRGARYTRGRAPITLLGHAPFLGRGEAQRVEYRIKQQATSHKLALLASLGGDGFVAQDLAPRQRKENYGN